MSVGLGTAVGYLKLDVSGFASGVDSAISDMNHLDGKVKTASQGLQTIGSAISKTGAALTAGLTAPVVGFGAASVKAGMEFDTSISQVSAVAKATGEDLELIRDRAIEMGEKTRYSAKEVSDAMYYMGLAGWDAQQIYEGIPGVLALGAASGEDLARVSDIVTDSLTAFGKSAEDTTEFVNVLAEASRSSNTTVDMLGESFKYVGPVAGAFGYSIQDVATALGIFANNGVKGSQAGTGLRQALNALINPSEKAAAEMERYGVSLFNSDGSTKSLMQVMEELRGTFGGLAVDIHNADGEVMTGEEIMEKYGHSLPSSEMEKLTAVTKIFGVRALPGMLSVINASDESFYGLAEAINGAQDAYDGLG
ncbi:MAG: phage tail tape measure protein, partial [Lachnospiraceae bacterium]|nr:phage tail tape measure protein [Lachnospiraceae bacterium]